MRLYCTKTLQRVEIDEKGAKQALVDGLVPSVTQILDIINVGPHLTKWKIKNSLHYFEETGDMIAALEYQDTTGADYGTICHNLTEAYLLGQSFDEIEHEKTHLETSQPMFQWIDDNVDSCVFAETYFASASLRYGGTADFLLKLRNGELLLGDLKVKKHSKMFPMSPSASYKYQLCAYRNHFQKEYGSMQIANFLLANPNNKYYKGKPLLLPFIEQYRNKDWTKGFEAAKTLWFEKYEENED